MSVTVTPRAAQEILRVVKEQQLDPTQTALRLSVHGSGCSGYSYAMNFVKLEEVNAFEDTVYTFDGLSVAVDNKANSYLETTTIDFYESLERRGFVFSNPNAKTGCSGCSCSG